MLNILKLAEEASERLPAEKIRNVPVKDLELDEVGYKRRNLKPHHVGRQFGDAYIFIALERNIQAGDSISKLCVATAPGFSHHVEEGRERYSPGQFLGGTRQYVARRAEKRDPPAVVQAAH